MLPRTQLAALVSASLEAMAAKDRSVSSALEVCSHEGEDTHVDVEYQGDEFRIEIEGPMR